MQLQPSHILINPLVHIHMIPILNILKKKYINHQLYKILLFFHRNSQIRLSTFAHDIQLNKLDLNVK